MSRSQRIRITLGISVCLVGMAIFFLGPAIASYAYMSDMASSELEHRHRLADMNRTNISLAVGGVVLACISFIYVFVEWACWFIGPSY